MKSIGYYYCRSQSYKKIKSCSNTSLRQEEIDSFVFQEVLSLLKTPSLIQQELDRRAQEASNKDAFEQRELIAKKELAKLSHESNRLLDAYQCGMVDLNELKKRNLNLDILKKNLEKELKGLQALKYQDNSKFQFGNLFGDILSQIGKKANALTFDDKRKLLRLLVQEVVVHLDTISLVHCVSPMALTRQEFQLRVGGRI